MNDGAATKRVVYTRAGTACLVRGQPSSSTISCAPTFTRRSAMKDGVADGLEPHEASAVKRWRGMLIRVAVEEMQHLAAVWNITSALGGSPRFGRTNFPLDPGLLPAGIVVKLAPFSPEDACNTLCSWSGRTARRSRTAKGLSTSATMCAAVTLRA